jgi:hypothetical protein
MSSEDMSAVWQGDCTFIVLPDGSNKQFVLKHNPKFYADDFEVRNLCANGEVWTGRGQKSKKMYSGDPLLFDENMNSCGVLVTYGKFKYYNCGDLCGHNPPMRIFSKVKPTGHIIIRVYPGGKSWQVFVLDPYSSDYSVKYVSELKQL